MKTIYYNVSKCIHDFRLSVIHHRLCLPFVDELMHYMCTIFYNQIPLHHNKDIEQLNIKCLHHNMDIEQLNIKCLHHNMIIEQLNIKCLHHNMDIEQLNINQVSVSQHGH